MREVVRGPLKAAASTAFIVGTLLFLLNPPSLSGAEGLVTVLLVGGSVAMLAAWATVALMGRDAISEPEFERVVRRTEELAREPDLAAAATEFELLVAEAIDQLPDEFRELLERTPVVVSHRGVEHSAYGYYTATRWLATTTRTGSCSSKTRSSATSATTRTFFALRSSALSATSSPTTWAGASAACASSACRRAGWPTSLGGPRRGVRVA